MIKILEKRPRREACEMNRGESDVSRLGRNVAIELDVLAFDPRHRVTAPAADFPTLQPHDRGERACDVAAVYMCS
jgi:hypothetical protein